MGNLLWVYCTRAIAFLKYGIFFKVSIWLNIERYQQWWHHFWRQCTRTQTALWRGHFASYPVRPWQRTAQCLQSDQCPEANKRNYMLYDYFNFAINLIILIASFLEYWNLHCKQIHRFLHKQSAKHCFWKFYISYIYIPMFLGQF